MKQSKEEIIKSMLNEHLIDNEVAEQMRQDKKLSAKDTLYRKHLLMLVEQSKKDFAEGRYISVDEFFNSF